MDIGSVLGLVGRSFEPRQLDIVSDFGFSALCFVLSSCRAILVLSPHFMQVFQQILLRRSAEVLPGKDLAGDELFLGEGVDVHAGLFEGVLPDFVVEAFVPEVEFCTVPPGLFNHVAQVPVAPGDGRFQNAAVDAMELELEEFCAEVSFLVENQPLCVLEVACWFLCEPAEGCVGLGDEPAYGDVYLAGFVVNLSAHPG